MPALPDGDPAPEDGRLPDGLDWSRPLRAYVHVPFCRARCGYCDFNTYTAGELGGFDTAGYVAGIGQEIALAARVGQPQPLASVFFGGGTPSLLSADELGGVLRQLDRAFGLADDAEVTMEVNPEDVTPQAAAAWLDAGITRISLGMQSADLAALTVLDRKHTPGGAVRAAELVQAAGFGHVSLDLIYGIPGQSDESWRQTLLAALSAEPDHISAYALGVEPGTALARKVARGEIASTDPDRAAAQYDIADETLAAHGFQWYEISNWARPGGECQHNLGYWRNDNWWGFGPGAHSHVDGVRWWNVKRPATYRSMLAAGRSPAAGREVLDADARQMEAVMLQVRLAKGFDPGDRDLTQLEGLLEKTDGARLHLTRKGRMLADAVVRTLLD
ncbi:MAG: radical SAM family heme chaperone HemW [Candidatus Nanopelagicales bacterium]